MSVRHGSIEELTAALIAAARPQLSSDVPSAARGLYLATGDAGSDVAVGFWADALESSPRFANPADFPWTLANAPAGAIARALDVRGPSYTLIGGGAAMMAALAHAERDLARGRVREALVVGCDLAGGIQGAVLVLVAGDRPSPPAMSPLAAETLARFHGQVVGAGSPEEVS